MKTNSNMTRFRHAAGADVVRVLVVDDHAVVRSVVRHVLGKEQGIVVCGALATEARAVFAAVARCKPSLVLLDCGSKPEGLLMTQELLRRYRRLRVLVFSLYGEGLFASRVMGLGVHGYLQKGCALETLVEAVRTVGRGGRLPMKAVARR